MSVPLLQYFHLPDILSKPICLDDKIGGDDDGGRLCVLVDSLQEKSRERNGIDRNNRMSAALMACYFLRFYIAGISGSHMLRACVLLYA